MRSILKVFIPVLVGVSLVLAWRQMFPSEETQIQRQLSRLESLLSRSGQENVLERAASARALGQVLHPDIKLKFQHATGDYELNGLSSLQEAYLQTQMRVPEFELSIRDLLTNIAESRTEAESRFTAIVRGRSQQGRQDFREASEFRVEWIKLDGDWRISFFENVEALQFQ
ncbi:MAG: hypothetical protein EA369_03515 [Bradymonadales bacterium]|nr:MAG: hypothetical protein EA369_03515 [Bradymonadales bacterium]